MNDVMLDLETMSTQSNAAIVAIGAVMFDPHELVLGSPFYCQVSLRSAVEAGGHIDPDTVCWWLKQSDEARAEISGGTSSLKNQLLSFSEWVETGASPVTVRMWGNGAGFDNVILANAYRSCGMQPPWKFWNDRCYRTVVATNLGPKRSRKGVAHKALDDAVRQAEHLLMLAQARREAGMGELIP